MLTSTKSRGISSGRTGAGFLNHTQSTVCIAQLIVCHSAHSSSSAFLSQGVNVLLFQKTDDNKEQAIKKRKKREVSNLEEKSPKKNRVPKQG